MKSFVEYVGHYIVQYGNAPTQPKVNMINNFKLPEGGKFIQSFIGIINFYLEYNPYLRSD